MNSLNTASAVEFEFYFDMEKKAFRSLSQYRFRSRIWIPKMSKYELEHRMSQYRFRSRRKPFSFLPQKRETEKARRLG